MADAARREAFGLHAKGRRGRAENAPKCSTHPSAGGRVPAASVVVGAAGRHDAADHFG